MEVDFVEMERDLRIGREEKWKGRRNKKASRLNAHVQEFYIVNALTICYTHMLVKI